MNMPIQAERSGGVNGHPLILGILRADDSWSGLNWVGTGTGEKAPVGFWLTGAKSMDRICKRAAPGVARAWQLQFMREIDDRHMKNPGRTGDDRG
jgi:hypothetical protein